MRVNCPSVCSTEMEDRQLHREGCLIPPQHMAALVGALLISFLISCLGKVLLYTALASAGAKSYSFGAFKSVTR